MAELDPLTVLPNVFTVEDCTEVVKLVLDDRRYWLPRDRFYTLGAATYQDDPRMYPPMARAFNDVIVARKEFKRCIFAASTAATGAFLVPEVSDTSTVITPDGFGLPAFHIFDSDANGLEGSIHIDEPYLRVKWPNGYNLPFSFTLPLMLPEGGGGLNIWPDVTETQMERYAECGAVPPPVYVPYKVGSLYVHDGLTPHQIANPCELGASEHRITLQGHGVVDDSGQVCVYF